MTKRPDTSPPPLDIDPEESLGRAVVSSKDADRAHRNGIPINVFEGPRDTNVISMNRLDLQTEEEAVNVGKVVAFARGLNRSFYGWAVIVAEKVQCNGRIVKATPLPFNPFHADIVLPESVTNSDEERAQHAHELAIASTWRKSSKPNES